MSQLAELTNKLAAEGGKGGGGENLPPELGGENGATAGSAVVWRLWAEGSWWLLIR